MVIERFETPEPVVKKLTTKSSMDIVSAMTKPDAYEKAWCQALTDVTFEGETFKAPAEYDKFLTTLYGDYMQLPPEDQRENRHQIVQIDFGD